MTKRLAAALGGLSLLTFALVWAVVHYSLINIAAHGFAVIDMVQKPVTVSAGDAERVHMTLHMVYGDLRLEPGTSVLLSGNTRYNVAEFAPHVLYEEDGKRGQLLMEHAQSAFSTRLINRTGRINEWQLAIDDQTPIDELEVVVGMGSAHVDLHGIDLRHGKLSLLTGDFTVDLRGAWAQSSAVEIEGVTGVITVLLSAETGTVVIVEEGPHTLHTTGLTMLAAPPSPGWIPPASAEAAGLAGADAPNLEYEEFVEDYEYYANAAYGRNPTTLFVQVADPFGTINLIAEQPAQ